MRKNQEIKEISGMGRIIQGEAKVQKMSHLFFIYLPIKRCVDIGIKKGVIVAYRIEYDGAPPAPPTKKALQWAKHAFKNKKEK